MVGVRFPSKEDHPWPTGTRPQSSGTGRTKSDVCAIDQCAQGALGSAQGARSGRRQGCQDGRERAQTAIKELSKAASKGIVHKNSAARRIGRLSKQVAALQRGS
jgi:hypothetical protein